MTDPQRAGVTELLRAGWVERRQVVDVALVQSLRRDLGAGESEAIVLAREIKADVLLIDERLGRSSAARVGLPMTGLAGVLIEARRQGLLQDGALAIEQLRHAGFWISDQLAGLAEEG